jgi:deazaflavin-dependent oxidoreductase (nitroreductase family)
MLFGQEHVRRYVATGGAEGHDWQGVSVLILTTTGRRSGRSRSTPLIYGRFGHSYVVVASKGGAPSQPGWYLNLVEQPEVGVQVRGERFAARARTADTQERADLWGMMVAKWPAYNEYQRNTDRQIPVVVLEPTGNTG